MRGFRRWAVRLEFGVGGSTFYKAFWVAFGGDPRCLALVAAPLLLARVAGSEVLSSNCPSV